MRNFPLTPDSLYLLPFPFQQQNCCCALMQPTLPPFQSIPLLSSPNQMETGEFLQTETPIFILENGAHGETAHSSGDGRDFTFK